MAGQRVVSHSEGNAHHENGGKSYRVQSAIPQESPGQPRKENRASRNFQDSNKIREDDGDGDIIMRSGDSSAGSNRISSSGIPLANDDENNRDALLKQHLPKNKRAISGRRTASSTGVRKTSSSGRR